MSCESLIKMESLKKITECAIISPYIKGEKPVSLLIIAKPESGKSSVMKKYRENKGIVYVTDCTAYGITRDVLPKIASGEVRTIMIPDLLTPLSKETKTRQTFVAFLNSLIEEGIAKITSYSSVWNKDVNANVISAVTDEALNDARHGWAKIGFLSRFIVFSYSYDIFTVKEILSAYSDRGLDVGETKIKIPSGSVSIDLPNEIAERLNPIAMKVGEQFNLYGFRAKVNFRCLLKCLAHRNGRKVVTDEDFAEFIVLTKFMNFEYKAI